MASFVKDLWLFIKERKIYWLLPIIVTVAIVVALMVLSEGSSVAPFVYTLF